MSRPVKQTVEYFPHFVNDSKTIFVLESKWGNDGYSFWFRLLEMLCRTDGHSLCLSEPIEWDFFVSRMKVSDKTAKEILLQLSAIGKIDRNLWETDKIIWCQNLIDHLSTVYDRRKISLPEKPKGSISKGFLQQKPLRNEGKPQTVGVSVDNNPQMKVNEMKVNENTPSVSPSLEKKSYGKEFGKVRLTDDEYGKLVQRLGKDSAADYIERLDGWLAEGNTKKNHYATILNWFRKDGETQRPRKKTSYDLAEVEENVFKN